MQKKNKDKQKKFKKKFILCVEDIIKINEISLLTEDKINTLLPQQE